MTQTTGFHSKQKQKLVAIPVVAALLLAGCGAAKDGSEGTGAQPQKELKPVTIRAVVDNTVIDDFTEKTLKEALQVKYPHLTLDLIRPAQGMTLTELIATGVNPDILFTYNGNLAHYRTKQLEFDHRELV